MKKKIGGLIAVIGLTLILFVSYNYLKYLFSTPTVNLEQIYNQEGIRDVGEVNLTENEIKELDDIITLVDNSSLFFTVLTIVIGLLLIYYGLKLTGKILCKKNGSTNKTH